MTSDTYDDKYRFAQSIDQAMPEVFGWAVLGLEWVHTGEAVLAYANETGNYPARSVVVDGVAIGDWLHEQRQLVGSTALLDQRRMAWLEEFLPAWELTPDDLAWNDAANLLLNFVEEHERLPARDEASDGQNLGYWLERQRSADRTVGAGGLKPARGEWLDRNLPGWNTDLVARHAPAAS